MYGEGRMIQFQYTAWALFVLLTSMACTPTVKVEPPHEPITINLNIKLDADIRVKLEEDAKKDIAANPGIF
ncbi:YnbE-like lipoprotein [Nitrosomonas sp. PY1]|uniref:YnbE family lipoprotein n=1 Tax=Nitrosomonas sp. PY1 TaxID=1803906 RepID=UPI001FC80579|nr:YnbE family lipoprotein [Nitrosomonas sp. PY1]GKS70437.1 YnbE-like lipoprotein [Nitrosomonas sp. PY1]